MAMQLYPFNGQMTVNEIYSGIYNMIISQTVFGSPIKGVYGGLAEKFKTDGTLYGDTKLFYSTQIGEVEDWLNDSEAANLLDLKRAPSPACQAVTIDVFKKIWLTVDNFLSKRAFSSESVFSQFNSVILATIRDTKRVYEATMVNAYVGTEVTEEGKQVLEVTIPDVSGSIEGSDDTFVVTDAEAVNRLEAETIAQAIADLLVDVEDVNADYNDLGYLRSYNKEDLVFVFNSAWVNKIRKVDLPTIFHNDALIAKFAENVIPARYFGTRNAATVATADDNTRALKDVKIGTTYYRAGDKIPSGTSLSGVASYEEDANVICKIVHKDAIQYMSAFETMTEFYNPRSLTQNHYLIFGHSDLEKSRLKEFPFITVVKAAD